MAYLGADQWSVYWAKGTVTTFQDIFEKNYDGEILEFWREIFNAAPAGASLVDLACGNGALSLLAARHSKDTASNFVIDAVDFADIQPPEDPDYIELLDTISFHPRTPIEDTSLITGHYDLAISQFGMEYGDPSRTTTELHRILKPAGSRLAALCHHAGSEIIQQAHRAMADIDVCLASSAPDLVRRLQSRLDKVRKQGRDPSQDPACEKLRKKLNRETERLHAAAEAANNSKQIGLFIQACMAPFSSRNMRDGSLKQRLALVDGFIDETHAYRARMGDLLSAAMSEQDVADFINAMTANGFQVLRNEDLEFRDQKFARALILHR